MKKYLKLAALFGVVCVWSLVELNASEKTKNGKIIQVEDKEYIVRCIMGYKWIQFVEQGVGVGREDLYFPSGNPQQLFQRHSWHNGAIATLPVVCDK